MFASAAEFSYSQDKLPEINVVELHSNLFKFSCGVNNWIVFTGPDGVLLSDSGPEAYGKALISELAKPRYGDVKFIINTHWHHDHTGGNILFGKDATIIAHRSVREDLTLEKRISHDDAVYKPYPEYALPDLTFDQGMKIHFNDEEITIKHFPNGHTGGDAVVYFKNADVFYVGDIMVKGIFPPVDYDNGGDVEQLAENIKIIISEMNSNTRIITGHLQDADKQDLIDYRDMILSTVAIVKNEMRKGMSLQEMQRKEILKEWKEWGKHITSEMWIEIIYECARRK